MEITLGSQNYFLTERGKFCADANALTVVNADECQKVAERILYMPYTWTFKPSSDDEYAPFGCFLRHQKTHKHYGVNFRFIVPGIRNENNIDASSICKKGNS